MTGGDGDVSPPVPPHAGTPISSFSAVPGSASSSDVRRSMKRAIEPALAGGSSVATLGSSPPPEPDAPGMHTCCGKSFKSKHAVNGHMRIHKRKKTSETKGHGSTVAEGGVSSSVAEAQRKKKTPLPFNPNEVPKNDFNLNEVPKNDFNLNEVPKNDDREGA